MKGRSINPGFVLCITLSFMVALTVSQSGCGSSIVSSTVPAERNPCEELQELEEEYEQMNVAGEHEETTLRDVRFNLSRLRLECEQFKQRVDHYRNAFGLTEEEAIERAAFGGSVVDRTPVMPEHSDSGPWLTIGIVIGAIAAVCLTIVMLSFQSWASGPN